MSVIDIADNPWRSDFPALQTQVYGRDLVYLDSAATAQTPQCVIDRMTRFYTEEYATVHRGAHFMSMKATDDLETARASVANFLGAKNSESILFTKGTTESINLVANSFLRSKVTKGDEIIVTEMEHHANLVPWQMLAESRNLTIRVWPINDKGELELQELEKLINPRTKLLAVTQVSNVLGTVNPVKQYIELAHKLGVPVLVDGAQSVVHQPIDVEELGCDFFVFSAHKLYGPTGVGVLYSKSQHLAEMLPWEGGGAMIDQVKLPTGTSYGDAPWRFEAGTPNVAGILGLGEAIAYINNIGVAAIADYEDRLMEYMVHQLSEVKDLTLYGEPEKRAGVASFNLSQHHAFDVGAFLDRYGIAIRTGHHCAMPLLNKLNVSAVCRPSIAMYNNSQDIDALVFGLNRISQLLR
ncbi:SufS family cysteine desulfurase [Vibrio sonorensis]|uniref:SufS family cysteine desulfurase n=1 Tax=Vibrio sonorensis TaxID=1004316 RepID=UPI0008D971E1|nr:SufS family cysteine desulfurase [Vibrio sonorensis]